MVVHVLRGKLVMYYMFLFVGYVVELANAKGSVLQLTGWSVALSKKHGKLKPNTPYCLNMPG